MFRTITALTLGAMLLAGLTACGPSVRTAQFHADDNPASLSAWQIFDVSSGQLELSDRVVPYDLNTPLFTDYAHKLRTVWVPPGAPPADLNIGGAPAFPVGTVISKTFYYPRESAGGDAVLKRADPGGQLNPILADLSRVNLIETRLLVRRDAGWEAVSYVWNAAQTDAVLTKIGDVQPLSLIEPDGERQDFTYIVPDVNQCAGCHAPNNTSREIQPLGLRARHINKSYDYAGAELNQISHLTALDYLSADISGADIPANRDWTDESLTIDARARSYLDTNCAHCHNPVGPADTSGLDLTMDAAPGPALGICKLPIAAGSGTGGRTFSIVPGEPDASILLYRLETTKPGAMMPELGRSLQHEEGVALIRQWIAAMDGTCAS